MCSQWHSMNNSAHLCPLSILNMLVHSLLFEKWITVLYYPRGIDNSLSVGGTLLSTFEESEKIKNQEIFMPSSPITGNCSASDAGER